MHERPTFFPRLLVLAVLSFGLAVTTAPAPCAAQEHDDEAHGLFSAGAAAFASGRYDEALEYFQRAYDLSGRSALLYNVGQAADRSRHDAIALDAFRRYLEANPDVENRAEIEGRIRVLERAQAEGTPAEAATDEAATSDAAPVETTTTETTTTTSGAAAPPSETTPAPAPSGGGIDIAGLSLTVGGAVFAIAGAIMVGIGAPNIDPLPPDATDAQIRGHQTNLILTGVGAAVLCVGVIAGVIGAVILATSTNGNGTATALRIDANGIGFAF